MTGQDSPSLWEAAFFILLSLSATPTHGCTIMKDAARLDNGRVALCSGTFGTLLPPKQRVLAFLVPNVLFHPRT